MLYSSLYVFHGWWAGDLIILQLWEENVPHFYTRIYIKMLQTHHLHHRNISSLVHSEPHISCIF